MVLWQQLDNEVRKGLGTTSQVTAANLVWPTPCPGCGQQELAKDQPVPQAPLSPITSKRKEMEKHREITDEPIPTSEMLWCSFPWCSGHTVEKVSSERCKNLQRHQSTYVTKSYQSNAVLKHRLIKSHFLFS